MHSFCHLEKNINKIDQQLQKNFTKPILLQNLLQTLLQSTRRPTYRNIQNRLTQQMLLHQSYLKPEDNILQFRYGTVKILWSSSLIQKRLRAPATDKSSLTQYKNLEHKGKPQQKLITIIISKQGQPETISLIRQKNNSSHLP